MNLRFEEELKKERRKNFIKELLWFLAAAVIVVFLAWLIVRFALKKVSVIGSAMENTLFNGEDVIVNRTSYLVFSPRRESVIAFYPEPEEGETLESMDDSSVMIRRVIGLPGETVQILDGKIYIDGNEIKEAYDFRMLSSAGLANSEITLGDGEYFVLSDNRNDMDDSRNNSFTKVRRENIIGRVILKLNPFSLIGGPDPERESEES